MGLRAIADHVIVKRIAETEEIVNGVVRPDIAKEKPQEGFVITVGNGLVENGVRVAVDVQVGDRVLFGKFSGQDIKIAGEEYLILREEDIFAVYTPDPEPVGNTASIATVGA